MDPAAVFVWEEYRTFRLPEVGNAVTGIVRRVRNAVWSTGKAGAAVVKLKIK